VELTVPRLPLFLQETCRVSPLGGASRGHTKLCLHCGSVQFWITCPPAPPTSAQTAHAQEDVGPMLRPGASGSSSTRRSVGPPSPPPLGVEGRARKDPRRGRARSGSVTLVSWGWESPSVSLQ